LTTSTFPERPRLSLRLIPLQITDSGYHFIIPLRHAAKNSCLHRHSSIQNARSQRADCGHSYEHIISVILLKTPKGTHHL